MLPPPDAPPESPLDLQPHWRRSLSDGSTCAALHHPWAGRHRPDWAERGLIVWPRGGQWCLLQLSLSCPESWLQLGPQVVCGRLALRWWAEAAELWVQGQLVHQGDLFDSSCRWFLPDAWWQGGAWSVELRLRSPKHDDGALVLSQLVLEPRDPADPQGILAPTVAELQSMRREAGFAAGLRDGAAGGSWQVLGHAHLDLAWLWPVADTWQAAERTFHSVLRLMEHQSQLHFGHSTPALYAWLQEHRPALYGRIREAMRRGRWEPLNGPWVECDCVLIGTLSLLRQFQEGQWFSRAAFPEWTHPVAWLPDSFGFSAGLPPVAAATGVRWFCSHKLAWNGSNPFPHRLFRWRGRCGKEVLALMTAPIGTDGDPVAMERYRLAWQKVTGVGDALWLPGVGDHGGGPTLEMLEQLALWQGRDGTAPQQHGTLRAYLSRLEPLAPTLPVWRDELYLELHRGCATSRPDQKRHNRTLERLLREADTALALLAAVGGGDRSGSPQPEPTDWRPLLFQQFHDILPGTSIPEVFEQAEPIWRRARRQSRARRDQALCQLLGGGPPGREESNVWIACQLPCLPPVPRTLRLPHGPWQMRQGGVLPSQKASAGGEWVQLPGLDGVAALVLTRSAEKANNPTRSISVHHPVVVRSVESPAGEGWRLENGLVALTLGASGVEQLWDRQGRAQLSGPLRWCRYGDRGEFWDAWDLAENYPHHPLPWIWEGRPEWLEQGPLCARLMWRGRCGESSVRLEGALLAGSPWFELVLQVDWRQRHELLRLQVPLASPICRWAADTPGGVIERPAEPRQPREQARWEVATLSWIASVQGGGGDGLAVLLDGPQGVSAGVEELGVSLLRAPTWPDPGADHGLQRLRLALMPAPEGWRRAAVPHQACRFRDPLWLRPVASPREGFQMPLFPSQESDIEVVGFQPRSTGTGEVVVTLQNMGPIRRHVRVGDHWEVVGEVDGLHSTELSPENKRTQTMLKPWSLSFWVLRPRQSS
ncbi:MAG: glycoside hydrolase family 38 C-terminal domain-containing protein [Cyanobacteriota bacterium]|nr:glycoside hydrolase family 38 C-terminal domain-containing protein [Cyanobacteriota bacterium]